MVLGGAGRVIGIGRESIVRDRSMEDQCDLLGSKSLVLSQGLIARA